MRIFIVSLQNLKARVKRFGVEKAFLYQPAGWHWNEANLLEYQRVSASPASMVAFQPVASKTLDIMFNPGRLSSIPSLEKARVSQR